MVMRPEVLLVVGFAGQGCYALRFLVQWIASEKKGESTIPVVFWYLSLVAAALLFTYAFVRKDPVIMAGQLTGALVYLRNLALIRRKPALGPAGTP